MKTMDCLAGAIALTLAAAPAAAALAPNYQRLAELNAALNDSGVAAAFGMTPIDRVEYLSPDLYRATAGRCHVDVRIVGLPMPRNMVGARRFETRAGRRICAR